MKKALSNLLISILFTTLGSIADAAPQAPVLTTLVQDLNATLQWSHVDNAEGYTLCYAPYPEGSPISCMDAGDQTTGIFQLWEGASYYVACKAYNEDGDSPYSNVKALTINTQSSVPGNTAFQHMLHISDTFGIRFAGTESELATRDYIIHSFLDSGLTVSTQKFEFENEETFGESFNVIGMIPGASASQVIIGAHYDSVEVGKGASDNASGVAALLTIAREMTSQYLPYTIKFIAFGAEEVGLKGSDAYASQMDEKEIQNTIAMVNLDTLVGGDKIYVYGGADTKGWIREQALTIARAMQIPLETNPGLNPDYPAGTTGDWSDHAPFKYLGIPYACFESTNWEIGDLDGYQQTIEFGEIWHTENDTMAFFQKEFPGRIEAQLTDMVTVLNELLITIEPPESTSRTTRKQLSPERYIKRNGATR